MEFPIKYRSNIYNDNSLIDIYIETYKNIEIYKTR